MITINELIEMSKAELEAERNIDKDYRVAECYRKFPELAAMDGDLVELRKSAMIASLEGRDDYAGRFGSKEAALRQKRENYLRDNNIPADFDSEKFICDKCNDTGYIAGKDGTRKVCSCMKEQLEECYDNSGMRDYRSVKLESYRNGYLGDEAGRKKRMNMILSACLGRGDNADKDIWIYQGAPQTGKTFLTIVVAKGMINLGKSAIYCKCEAIEDMEEEDIEDLKICDVLFIDDFAADISSRRKIAYILNTVFEVRKASGRKTLIVSYETQNQLVSDCDIRLAGKLKNAGYIS
ncbi:MAG: hypothetical protein J5715_01840 [Clostridiales bacterium]|nr:hypothetical protein [Clostridiales bacterium]